MIQTDHKKISKKDSKVRLKHLSKEEKEKYYTFRTLLWDAIDNKKDISIIETAKQLNMKGKAYNLEEK